MKELGWIIICGVFLLSACEDKEAGGVVSYDHAPNAVCPPPIIVSPQIAAAFGQYADDPLIQQFYMHYLKQQRELAGFQSHSPEVPHCPAAFWVQDNVAAEFAKLPQGDPLREFFKTYAVQQRALDAYYSPPVPLK